MDQSAGFDTAQQNGLQPARQGKQIHHPAPKVTHIMVAPTTDKPRTAVVASDAHPQPRGRLFDPLAVAALAVVVSGAAAGRPSLWFDEGATISASASRSLPQLWQLLGYIDAVHGLYYLLMHGWFAVFPPTEFWSRAPGCLAIGIAAAGVVVLGKQFSTRGVAACAGVVFAILPRVTWAGIEARSYALTALAAVWLTVLLVTSIRRNRWWLWLLYALALILSILLNIYLVLMVAAYVVITPIVGQRKAVLWWATSSAAALAIMTPFMMFAHGQRIQVAWISPLSWHSVIDVVQHQFFDNSVPFAVLAAVIIVSALGLRLTGRRESAGSTGHLLMVCAVWIVVPTAVSLIYSAITDPLYRPRYLSFTAPAMAIVLAVCIVTVARQPRWITAVLILLAAAAFPNYLLSQRQPYAKEGWDYSQVADVISDHAAPGDCLLVDNARWAPGPARALVGTRPAAFRPLVDIGRGARGAEHGTLWDGLAAVRLVKSRLKKCTTVWTIATHDTTLPAHQRGRSLPAGRVLRRAPVYLPPRQLGFHIVERWQFHRTQVVKSTR
jgi:mannosyltransferase